MLEGGTEDGDGPLPDGDEAKTKRFKTPPPDELPQPSDPMDIDTDTTAQTGGALAPVNSEAGEGAAAAPAGSPGGGVAMDVAMDAADASERTEQQQQEQQQQQRQQQHPTQPKQEEQLQQLEPPAPQQPQQQQQHPAQPRQEERLQQQEPPPPQQEPQQSQQQQQEQDDPPAPAPQLLQEHSLYKQPGGAYTQREDFLQNLEDAGDISFNYVENNGDPQNIIWLIGLKNIFSKQLPNMPKEYIARLVLDRRHRSVALVRRGGGVIGGITYRTFPQQGLGEIAFCAVTASEQVKGFGTRLMNHTKAAAQTRDGLSHFLTYADNNAVGYFIKQGFTKEITLDKARWAGFIKDYDGGTLMECCLHPKLPYTSIPNMLRRQRAELDSRIRGLSNSHIVHPGLTNFDNGRRCQVPIGDIPGVREAGWRQDVDGEGKGYRLLLPGGATEPTAEAMKQFMALVVKQLKSHDEAWPFLEPVDPVEVEDYYDIIRDPIDLSLIEAHLHEGYYLTLDMFAADFRRMIANCKTYNSPDTVWYKASDKLDQYFHTFFTSHVEHY